MIRASVKSLKDRRPAYGEERSDGSFVETDGTVHLAGTWFRSRPAAGAAEEENPASNNSQIDLELMP